METETFLTTIDNATEEEQGFFKKILESNFSFEELFFFYIETVPYGNLKKFYFLEAIKKAEKYDDFKKLLQHFISFRVFGRKEEAIEYQEYIVSKTLHQKLSFEELFDLEDFLIKEYPTLYKQNEERILVRAASLAKNKSEVYRTFSFDNNILYFETISKIFLEAEDGDGDKKISFADMFSHAFLRCVKYQDSSFVDLLIKWLCPKRVNIGHSFLKMILIAMLIPINEKNLESWLRMVRCKIDYKENDSVDDILFVRIALVCTKIGELQVMERKTSPKTFSGYFVREKIEELRCKI